MVVVYDRLCLTALLAACFLSFAWGMRYFFQHTENWSTGMKITQMCGTVFAVLHLGAILLGSLGAVGIAAGLYLCSLALFWWAIRTNRPHPLSAAFLDDLPVHLVERGPYRYVRHPFYTSYLLAWLAGVVAVGRLWLTPTLLVMLAIYWQASQAEEGKFARGNLAAAYEAYRAKTGRFLPNLWKLAGVGNRPPTVAPSIVEKCGVKDAPRLD